MAREFIRNQDEDIQTPKFGVTPISQIKLDPYSRDETTKFLRGAQLIYGDLTLRQEIQVILTKMIPEETSHDKGRRGMDLWSIFILGSLRLVCNWDYDRVKDAHDNHKRVRQMISIDEFCDADKVISLRAVQQNTVLLTNEICQEIDEQIVKFAHEKLFPNMKRIEARCDSFVFLSNVHFPTDFNLLLDSMRSIIRLCANHAESKGLSGWREDKSLFHKLKSRYNTLSKMRNSNSKNEAKKAKRTAEIHTEIRSYLDQSLKLILKAKAYKSSLNEEINGLDTFIGYAELFIDQITRRVFEEEKIPQAEKVYSIYEPYTEWICKGKAGVRQELGVKFGILQDQHGFILNSRMMFKEEDKDVAFAMAEKSKTNFPLLYSISFDKGYHSKLDKDGKNNRTRIEDELDVKAIIPVKGGKNSSDKERESEQSFGDARKKHPAVESGINALESHGMDRCPDRGVENFERYASTAVLASNIHLLGAITMQRELDQIRRKNKRRKAS